MYNKETILRARSRARLIDQSIFYNIPLELELSLCTFSFSFLTSTLFSHAIYIGRLSLTQIENYGFLFYLDFRCKKTYRYSKLEI